ncbi:membrane protein insertase YidC [Candidatus Comchoanobacter bicostacola]|uniref:Membrane protein insertase YidC n=1 Tax=Candidatus Comchoanobacter bicostacola TaxID=2919598 RepID=A0ABY5DJS3_9GAMM|nr:membrane protein insertase YidC [Candidatus Comchoanobacter bicostacola]UTC24554.1 membrane protein insertase YidC [Candidatus Comchoanobacter bicostacola]
MLSKNFKEAALNFLTILAFVFSINMVVSKVYGYFTTEETQTYFSWGISTNPTVPQNYNQMVSVDTDVFTVMLDMNGGDVISVVLKNYFDEAGQPYQVIGGDDKKGLLTSSNLDSETIVFQPKLKRSQYSLSEDDQLTLQLTAQKDGVRYYKNYTFTRGSYQVDVETYMKNTSQDTAIVQPKVHIMGFLNTDLNTEEAPKIGKVSVHGVKPGGFGIAKLYEGFSQSGEKKSYQQVQVADLPKTAESVRTGGWFSYQDGHFVTAWVMPESYRHKLSYTWYDQREQDDADQRYAMSSRGEKVSIPPGAEHNVAMTLYAGPALVDQLSKLSPGLKLTIDYGFLWMLSSLMASLLAFIHSFGVSWGWCVVLLTVLIRLAFYKQAKDQKVQGDKMKVVKAELEAVDQKYEGRSMTDPEVSEAKLAVYRKNGISPASGCLMPLLSMPFYFAMFRMVSVNVVLRSQPFLWISDLTQPDPYYILPVMAMLGLYAQSRSMPIVDPSMKVVTRVLPLVVFVGMMATPSAGALYVATQMAFQAIQTKLLDK